MMLAVEDSDIKMDRISNLPNDIISKIVCSLSAKEAAFASVLSKKWRNLFTVIPDLKFDDKVKKQGTLTEFLDEESALPLSSRIRNLSLKCRKRMDQIYHPQVNRFLCNVLKRGVLALKLDLQVDEGYSLPSEVFTCKTLVELELGSILKIDLLPKNALLPALKTLIIDGVRFSDHCGCAFQNLFSACTMLVELVIRNVVWEFWEWSRTLSSQTLERLTMNHKYFSSFGIVEYDDMESITFDTPSLTYLEYYDFAPSSYSTVNLGSLVEATIGFNLPSDKAWIGQYPGDDDTETCDISNLIKGLSNVEILNINTTETMEAIYFCREDIPVFEKLHRLSIPTKRELCWKALPYLLKKCPNLKTLVIEGRLHYLRLWDDYDKEEKPIDHDEDYESDYTDVDNDDDVLSTCECLSEYSFLLTCPVKVLEITEYSGTEGELEQMKHILEKLPCLELVKVPFKTCDEEELRTYLLSLPRSSKCKIELESIS